MGSNDVPVAVADDSTQLGDLSVGSLKLSFNLLDLSLKAVDLLECCISLNLNGLNSMPGDVCGRSGVILDSGSDLVRSSGLRGDGLRRSNDHLLGDNLHLGSRLEGDWHGLDSVQGVCKARLY